jgi:hypothetical protein
MPFLTKGKTNWKYILIVLILAVIVGGGILWWLTLPIPPPWQPPPSAGCSECKLKFISWCENCRSLGWPLELKESQLLPGDIKQCLEKCFRIISPKTASCGAMKKNCKNFGVLVEVTPEELPEDVVKKFLDNYTKNPLGKLIQALQPDFASEIAKFPELSNSYKQRLLKDLEEQSFGPFGDPVLFVEVHQTVPTGIEIEKSEIQPDKASVWINMKYGMANHKLRADLLLIDNQWKIDDIKWLKEEEIRSEDVTNRALQVHMSRAVSPLWDNPDFTPDYKVRIKKNLESQIMVDPVIFAQATPDTPIEVSKATVSGEKSSIMVKMFGCPHLDVELLLIDGQWKINNIGLFEKTYENKDFGFAFSYPKDWQVINESKYQRAVCYDPEYRKKDLTCDKEPLVNLGKDGKILLSINLRQCLNIIELSGGHFICFDPALPADKKGDYFDKTGERMKYLDPEISQCAIPDIRDSFQLLK